MNKKILVAIAILLGVGLCLVSTLYSQEPILTGKEEAAIKGPVDEMVKRGANKDEVRGIVSDMAKKGIRGDDLKSSAEAMNDLVKRGESPKEAGNLVSRAAHQAKAEGLKGRDLADRVHGAVKQTQEAKRGKMENTATGGSMKGPGGGGGGRGKR